MQAFPIGDSAYTILRCLNINKEKEDFSTGWDRGGCVLQSLILPGTHLMTNHLTENQCPMLCFNKAEHSSSPN